MRVTTLSYATSTGWSEPLPEWDSSRTLVLVFAAPEYVESDIFAEIAATYPNSVVVGCSTAGEIMGPVMSDHTLSVAVVRFESTDIRLAWELIDSATESREVGHRIGQQLDDPDLKAALIFSEGLKVDGTGLVHAVSAAVGEDVILTGGLAGDGQRFETTWVLADGKPTLGAVSAVGFYGSSVRMGYGVKGGWSIFGPERTVTRSEGTVLYELDRKPALDLYEQYLGDLATDLPASGLLFPLAIRQPGTDQNLVRTILAIDRKTRSLTFAGDIPTGSMARLMQANLDHIIEGAETAAIQAAASGAGQGEMLAVVMSCVGRRMLLADRTEEELEFAWDALSEGTSMIGFYSYGELSPHDGGTCELHNETLVMATIGEVVA